MELNEYQKKASNTAKYPKIGDSGFLYPVLGLSGETGEVLEKVKKLFRDKNGNIDDDFLDDIKKELGDVLWYISQISKEFNFDLEDVAKTNLEKLQSRKIRNKIQGDGDDR